MNDSEKTIDDKLFDFLESLGIENPRMTHYVDVTNLTHSIISINDPNEIDEKDDEIIELRLEIEELSDECSLIHNDLEELQNKSVSSLNEIINDLDSVIESLNTNSPVVDKETVDKAVDELKLIKTNVELDKKEIDSYAY